MKRVGCSRSRTALRSRYCRSNKTIRQFHNIFDFFRPSSNPVTDDILTRKGSDDESEIVRSTQLPSYSQWKSIHLEDAAEACKLQHEEKASELENRLCDALSFFKNENVNSEKASSVLSGIVGDWDQLLSPLNQLKNSSYMLYLMSEESEKSNWGQAFDRLSSILPDSTTNLTGEGNHNDAKHTKFLGLLAVTLHEALAKVGASSAPHGDATWAARYLERSIRKNLGLGLSEEEKSLFDSIQSSLSTVERNILERESTPTKGESASFLSDCYSLLDLRRRNAALLGYSNFGELVLEERMASVDEVRNLHEDVAASFLPLAEGIDYNPFDPKILDTNNVVKPTLNGCLMAINKVTSNLFGVEIREDNTSERDRAVWSRFVRLFNLHDHDNKDSEGEPQYLGSILLDPYKRPGKMSRSFLTPLRFRGEGEHSQPLVGISLCTATPVWDDVSADISWDDAEALWHEFGHALQIILAKPSYGGICGAHNLALDVSEILPKVSAVMSRSFKLSFCAYTFLLCTVLAMAFLTQPLTPEVHGALSLRQVQSVVCRGMLRKRSGFVQPHD